MKVICDRAALLDAVNLISGVVAVRTPRPQLTCVKLTATKTAGGAELVLSATDAEISLRLKTGRVDVVKPGEALIPADKLRQIVSAEENEPTLTVEVTKDVCEIRGEDARFKIFGYPPSDFPEIPDFQSAVTGTANQPKAKAVFSHPAGLLKTMIARTLFATARENSRYAINGVLLKREGKKLEMVATDGRRLALCRSTVQGDGKDSQAVSCIVPTKALSMLTKLFEDDEERISVAITDNQILVAFGVGEKKDGYADARAVLASNLVEGAFPPYEEVIPKDQDKRIVFDRDVLSSAVRRAALLTNEESRGVRMKFKGSDKQVELSSRVPEMGEAEVNIDLAEYTGDDVEIGFNPLFLTDALKVISDPQVIMELKAPNKPGLVRSGADFLYVIMPVNLQ
jgi:DNA polymerase III subunit beta